MTTKTQAQLVSTKWMDAYCKKFESMDLALRAIANTKVDEDTNLAQALALVIAIAKVETEHGGGWTDYR